MPLCRFTLAMTMVSRIVFSSVPAVKLTSNATN